MFIKFLLRQGNINLNAQSYHGYTALTKALDSGYPEVAEFLLEQEQTNVLPTKQNSKNALLIALVNKDWYLVDLILNKNPESKAQVLGHALITASDEGELEAVKFLLDQSETDVNFIGFDGQTALSAASYKLHLNVVDLLLDQENIDVKHIDDQGYTALHYVILGRSRVSFLNSLTKTSEDIKADTAHAILKLFLVNKDLDVNIFDQEKGSRRTALMLATERGYEGIVKLLLEHLKTDVNLQSIEEKWSPLMMAAINEDLALVKLFLNQRGIDLELRNSDDQNVFELVLENLKDQKSSAALKEIRKLIFFKMNQ